MFGIIMIFSAFVFYCCSLSTYECTLRILAIILDLGVNFE